MPYSSESDQTSSWAFGDEETGATGKNELLAAASGITTDHYFT